MLVMSRVMPRRREILRFRDWVRRECLSGGGWRFGVAVALVCAVAPMPFSLAKDVAAPADAPPAVVPTSEHDLFVMQIDALDAKLATLLQRRPDAAGSSLALIDYDIDLALVQRWMLNGAISSKADDLQAVVALRLSALSGLGAEINARLKNSDTTLTAAQLQGLKKLHDLTYAFPAFKGVGTIDEVCKNVATALILISAVSPAEVANLPLMRPSPVSQPTAGPAQAPTTIEMLARRADSSNASDGLKRQLKALAAAASAAAADPKSGDDAARLYEMLSASVALADGLGRGMAIDAASRPKIEQQLTEGLALFTDPRTRQAGQNRISALTQFRQTLARVDRLHIPAALQQQLAPAILYANSRPDSGGKILDLIEQYLSLCNRFDANKEATAPSPLQKRTTDILVRQFSARRTAFLADAADLGGKTTFSPGPQNLSSDIDQMRQALDGIETASRLPRALSALTAAHPRPTGALEKRVNQALIDLSSASPTVNHDASIKLLNDVEQVADLAQSLNAPSGIAPDITSRYTHGRLAAVATRRDALITALASELAGGHDLDSLELSKLHTLHDLLESLKLAAEVEGALAKADSLSRWVDFSISAAQLRALVGPYRDATASAFDGFADENSTPVGRWSDVRTRFMPILILVKEVGLYGDACNAFPTGMAGQFARLLTPMDGQPFAVERYASMSVDLWQHVYPSDPKAGDAIFDAMLARLATDLHVSP